MSEYHQLSTQKYVDETMEAEAKAIRAHQNREAYIAFVQFSFALATLGLTMLAVYLMPSWLPSVSAFLENAGLLTG